MVVAAHFQLVSVIAGRVKPKHCPSDSHMVPLTTSQVKLDQNDASPLPAPDCSGITGHRLQCMLSCCRHSQRWQLHPPAGPGKQHRHCTRQQARQQDPACAVMQAYAVGAWQAVEAAVSKAGPATGPRLIHPNKVFWVPWIRTLCEPGRQWRQPFSMVASCRASHRPTTEGGSVYRYEESWWGMTSAPVWEFCAHTPLLRCSLVQLLVP